ncbi:hypothetical protein SLITO_v1c05620 [Spiroplasma litorale]|uniref:Uncharacterized protein n=1 Tax=Spiroplasma litorale TaxID=216942 RepID=A0A0K1W1K2_9MOLU|nr:hypothetical protein [Spiroplasma litorale]AKX34200.1 hypothetical protein SLITO_v1c05620 [Spiroplasma litorale]
MNDENKNYKRKLKKSNKYIIKNIKNDYKNNKIHKSLYKEAIKNQKNIYKINFKKKQQLI